MSVHAKKENHTSCGARFFFLKYPVNIPCRNTTVAIVRVNTKAPSFLFTRANRAHLQAHARAVRRSAMLLALFVAAVNTAVVSDGRVALDESRRVNWRK